MTSSGVSPLEHAASALWNADYLLIAAGAGFSADSGLPTYASSTCVATDAPNQNAYHQRGMCYRDVCRPLWVYEDPSLFYGFWARCTDLYERVPSHEGFAILQRWVSAGTDGDPDVPYASLPRLRRRSTKIHRRYWVYTSNVDGHFLRWFPPAQVSEIHGHVQHWQCSVPCSGDLLPLHPDIAIQLRNIADPSSAPSSFMPCPRCHDGRLRPWVVMFGDDQCIIKDCMHLDYQSWECGVENTLRRQRAGSQQEQQQQQVERMVILELGCGTVVPSVRQECETVLNDAPAGSVTLIRVNPLEAEIDNAAALCDKGTQDNFISLRMTGLQALRQLDAILRHMHLQPF